MNLPEETGPNSEKSGTSLVRNAGITAAILLAPGGFILGGILLARALKKRREAAEQQDSAPQED